MVLSRSKIQVASGLLMPVAIAVGLMLATCQYSSADLVEFVFEGSAGPGVLAASESGDTGIATGGALAPIIFDTDTNELTLNIGWGSGNGFVDLTSPVSLLNIHGPTDAPAPDSFNQSGPALMTLNGGDTSPTNGGFNDTVVIPVANVNDLLTGRLYLHIHTDNNPGGEARGYFIALAVPEPGTAGLTGIISLIVVMRRRSRIRQNSGGSRLTS